jgi:hypothetical protein
MLEVGFHVLTAVSMKTTDSLLGYGPLAIALMMEAVRTSETSVYFYETTLHHIPAGCHLLNVTDRLRSLVMVYGPK